MTPKEKTGRYKYIRYIICYGVLSLLFLIFFLWNINAGSVDLSVKEIAEILFFHSGDEMEYGIVWKIRLPRIIAAAVLGGALALAGFLMQIFFRNPIAGPFVLGISSGAKMTVALTMIFLLKRGLPKNVPLIFYCERGSVSMVAAREMAEKGYRAKSLTGGIHSWHRRLG